ncbi:MAG: DmsC/YnfH family molybdoenzyme membrane anchor subunit [Bacillota bacterium]
MAKSRSHLSWGFCWLKFFVPGLGFWYKDDSKKRAVIGGASAVMGVLAIFSSAMIYVLPAIPAWNGMTTIISFLLTSLLLGPLFVVEILAIRGEFVILAIYQ